MSATGPVAVRPMQLVVRYFAEPKNAQWQAFSIEFGLAAQADTLADVREKLEAMIASYLDDALTCDRKHAKRLLSRRSTLSVWIKYHFYAALSKLRHSKFDSGGNVFSEALPVAPCSV